MKFCLINIVFVLVVAIMAFLSPFLLLTAVPLYIAGGRQSSDRYINRLARMYARFLLGIFGIRVDVYGSENIPSSNNLCFISNHQGLADIPLIVGFIPKSVGFIAKKELGLIPFLNIWMSAMGCILIDRKNKRNSLQTIERGIRQIQKGHPMVIFPEGTRSKSPNMNRFKPGSFKLVTGSGALAVPVTINGTYKILEETGKITSTRVLLTIHPAIDVSALPENETQGLYLTVETIVKSGLR